MERLQKIIASRGLCSRREAERWLLEGRVTVNGVIARLGQLAQPDTDCIAVDGVSLPQMDEKRYIMLYKPRGYVTTLRDEKGRKNVSQLVADCGCRVYPVGRLDLDSEGLLLFTNDGAFANELMHPKHQVDKVYRVWVTGYTPENQALLARPIVLDGYRIRPPKVRRIQTQGDRAELEVTIHEGRNRQIRRMCQQAGMTVTRLKRIQEGALRLGALKPGQWRDLTTVELEALGNDFCN